MNASVQKQRAERWKVSTDKLEESHSPGATKTCYLVKVFYVDLHVTLNSRSI